MKLLLTLTLMFAGNQLWAADAAGEGAFPLTELPIGRSVTLPRPALTNVPLGASVKLSSTDLPQTVKMVGMTTAGAPAKPFQVAIYENEGKDVRYIKIDGTNPALYSFKSLTSIKLVPMPLPGDKSNQSVLILESTKPLSLSR